MNIERKDTPYTIRHKINDEFNVKFYVDRSNMWWTRGDGSRYKDWNYLEPYSLKPAERASTKQNERVMKVIYQLFEDSNYTSKFLLSGEFGSSEYAPAFLLNNYVYFMNKTRIYFGSKTRLKNSSVWRSKPFVDVV